MKSLFCLISPFLFFNTDVWIIQVPSTQIERERSASSKVNKKSVIIAVKNPLLIVYSIALICRHVQDVSTELKWRGIKGVNVYFTWKRYTVEGPIRQFTN